MVQFREVSGLGWVLMYSKYREQDLKTRPVLRWFQITKGSVACISVVVMIIRYTFACNGDVIVMELFQSQNSHNHYGSWYSFAI